MSDERYEKSFELIMWAGDAKSKAMMAIEAARESDFKQAKIYLKEAEANMRHAHQLQINLIQQEAQGNPIDVHIILVHAQDHITMAIMAVDYAKEFIHLYRMLDDMRRKNEGGNVA